MTEPELEEILRGRNVSLEVYNHRKDTLSALEISLKSHLIVLHAQVAEHLQDMRQQSHLVASKK